ncbi:MAG: DUF4129 domain-containing protein [Acidimicrobiales bacterium]|jgi:hypothetical protein
MRLALGLTVATLIIVLAVIGASAQHGTGVAQLRRGPASILLSVLITLAELAGLGSLALLFWGLVTRHRRNSGGSTHRRHSPILVAGVLLALFACMTGLLALAAAHRHLRPLSALGGTSVSHLNSTSTVPFNRVASFATTGVVVMIVVLLVLVRLTRSIGWHRALRRLFPLVAEGDDEEYSTSDEGFDGASLGSELAELSVPDPSTEPDPRRAVVVCYLQLLDIAARHGPARRRAETPSEYLRRVLTANGAAAAPATSLTKLFERARYSRQPVDESMRTQAIAALGALRGGLAVGAVG